MDKEKKQHPVEVTCFCPKCHEESFIVKIERTGKGFHQDYGEVHWFEGKGKCYVCGFEEYHSDSNI